VAVVERHLLEARGKRGLAVRLLHAGRPVLGLIDQPILRERWVGVAGEPSTWNGQPIRDWAQFRLGIANAQPGTEVDLATATGATPLMAAAGRGQLEAAKLLVEKGADVTAVSRRGQTTADMANGPVQRVPPFTRAMRSVRDERWKLIVYPPINHVQLFDLRNDPDEMHDLAGDADGAETIERLTRLMKSWQAKVMRLRPEMPISSQNACATSTPSVGKRRPPHCWSHIRCAPSCGCVTEPSIYERAIS
jgi:hypothetical protein